MLTRLLGPASIAMLAGFILGRARHKRRLAPEEPHREATSRQCLDRDSDGGAALSHVPPIRPARDAAARLTDIVAAEPFSRHREPPSADSPSPKGSAAAQTEPSSDEAMVWVNTKTRVYHFAGTRSYGRTRDGVYLRETQAAAGGNRPSRTERPFSKG